MGPRGTVFDHFVAVLKAGRRPRGSTDPPGRLLSNYQPEPPDGDPFCPIPDDFSQICFNIVWFLPIEKEVAKSIFARKVTEVFL